MSDLAELSKRGKTWLEGRALPLWGSAGIDATSGTFEEQLDFSGQPVRTVRRRVMVQARQIATFAAASLAGHYPQGGKLALAAGHAMLTHYHAVDGAPGFVFSIDRSGQITDGRRDLYAHAFVLFALSWLLRLDGDRLFLNAVDATLDFLDAHFADSENTGYWDCLPRPDARRRQNPHMHLFEAFISLIEVTGRSDILDRCRSLHHLAVTRFLDSSTGALREYFDDRWSVVPRAGQGSVEPGHLYEWAWLLRRYEALTGEDQSVFVEPMLRLAFGKGFDQPGRIIDEIGEDGMPRLHSSRCWPHTEALKALAVTRDDSPQSVELIRAILERLLNTFLPEHLNGGWIDHLDSNDRPLSQIMPASSLYHIYFGLTAALSPPQAEAQNP